MSYGALLVLRGCRDMKKVRNPKDTGGAFFPEQLRSELHGVRKTLEAFAKAAVIEGAEEATACGVVLQEGGAWKDVKVWATDGAGQAVTYVLDRWD